MPVKFAQIAQFFVKKLMPNPKFNSPEPNADQSLLFPAFLEQVNLCISLYNKSHENQDITFTETYRSNALQSIYYSNGASKIKENGMHHYGIAADCIFVISGKRTYKGDVVGLRKIFRDNNLFILGMWDALHVQFIPVNEQAALRNEVKKLIG